jgi:hypothetical protein
MKRKVQADPEGRRDDTGGQKRPVRFITSSRDPGESGKDIEKGEKMAEGGPLQIQEKGPI